MPSPASCYPLIVTVHTIYALACFGEYQLVNPISANLALETMRVIRVITSHDSFVEDGKFADIAAI